MGKITAISNQKGGVGKTTGTVNFGKNLARMGKKVLIVDNDPQGDTTMAIFGDDLPADILARDELGALYPSVANVYNLYVENAAVEPFKINDNLYIIGSNKHLIEMQSKPFEVTFEFREKLEKIVSEHSFDHALIDCPPEFGNLQTAAHMTADFLLIPTLLEPFSVRGVGEQLKTANSTKKRLNPKLDLVGIFASQSSKSKVLVEEHFYEELITEYKDFIFKTRVTRSTKVTESHAIRASIFEYKKYSDQARQYQELTQEFLARVGE